MRLNGVNAVTIRTDWSLPVPAADCLPVNALGEVLFHRSVAFGAGMGHIEFKNRRLGIGCVQNLVRAMAIRTHRRGFRSRGDRASMDTLLVGKERLRAVPAGSHDEFLAVAAAASLGNIQVAYF